MNKEAEEAVTKADKADVEAQSKADVADALQGGSAEQPAKPVAPVLQPAKEVAGAVPAKH